MLQTSTNLDSVAALATPIPRFWQTVQHLNIRQELPNVRFMAWDFDQSIANMEPLHHDAFRGAAIKLIKTVDNTFTEKDQRFNEFWMLARRGFGLQEMDTIKVFTKAISRVWPQHAGDLLAHHAQSLPAEQRERILTTLTSLERLEPHAHYLKEDDFQAVVAKVRGAFKRIKDLVVEEILTQEKYVIREVPGAVELIKRGRAAGLLIGLATGSPSTVVQPILSRMGILNLFDATIYNDDPAIQGDSQRKPYPFPYAELTRRLGAQLNISLQPSEGIAFEDSLTGIRSAHSAGMPVIVRTPSLPWLFKKLLAPAGQFDGRARLMGTWERATQEKRERLIEELSRQSGTGLDKIFLLLQDVTDPSVREHKIRANRQHLSWDNVTV